MIVKELLENRVLRFRPPRIALGLVAAAALLSALLPFQAHTALVPAALFAGTAGFAIMLRAWWLFRRATTPICPTDTPAALVTNDVFSWTRNPMYLGMGVMLIAAGLWSGSAPYYVAAVTYFAIIQRHFIPYEESRLAALFGDKFAAYCARVRPWL